MSPRFRSPSKGTVFTVLMAVSLVSLLMPHDLFRPARGAIQLIALPQWMASEATRTVTEPISNLADRAVPAPEHEELLQEKQALQNQIVSLYQTITDLRRTNQELTRLRHRGLPSDARLLPARVISADAAARRNTLLVSQGSLNKVDPGDWVSSRLFVDTDDPDEVRGNAAVLARECLIGYVEQTAPFVSRVVLLSDPYAHRVVRVHIAHQSQQGKLRWVSQQGEPADFALKGKGQGTMQIVQIPAKYVDADVIAVGDLVASDPNEPRLPLALVIGEIVALEHDKSNPLYYDATVEHRFDPQRIGQVYIVDSP